MQSQHLGERLAAAGVLTDLQLKRCMPQGSWNIASLRSAIGTQLSEDALAGFLVAEGHGPLLKERELKSCSRAVALSLARKDAESLCALPLRHCAEGLNVAMVDPSDQPSKRLLETKLGTPVTACLSRWSQIKNQLDQLHKVPSTLEGPSAVEDASHPPWAARLGEPSWFEGELNAIEHAEDVDQAAKQACRLVHAFADRVVFMAMRKSSLQGWTGLGPGVEPLRLRQLALSLESPCAFRKAMMSRKPYQGELGDSHAEQLFRTELHPAPYEINLHPVVVEGRAAGLLCIEGICSEKCPTQGAERASEALGKAIRHARERRARARLPSRKQD